MKETQFEGKTIFVCEICGLGYLERVTAQQCEEWCGKNPGSCNSQISQKAVYPPDLVLPK